jgi:hypothetical protein
VYNTKALSTIVIFNGRSRGNFVRNCLTLSPDTADALLKLNDYNTRVKIYKEAALYSRSDQHKADKINKIDKVFWRFGPGHLDNFSNFGIGRYLQAEHADQYVHCCHLYQFLDTLDGLNIDRTKFENIKHVVITLTSDEIKLRDKKPGGDPPDVAERKLFNDIQNFSKFNTLYDLPYQDILIKEKFLEHCYNINPKCYTELISDYYDTYYDNCIIA